jgi:hypothetical protein
MISHLLDSPAVVTFTRRLEGEMSTLHRCWRDFILFFFFTTIPQTRNHTNDFILGSGSHGARLVWKKRYCVRELCRLGCFGGKSLQTGECLNENWTLVTNKPRGECGDFSLFICSSNQVTTSHLPSPSVFLKQ